MKRWLRATSVSAVAVLALFVASGWIAVGALRSRAKPSYDEPPPQSWSGRVESLRLRASDGEELGAWFVEAREPSAPTVILLHGKGGGRSARVQAAEVFLERGCAALLVTLRAHGDSSGASEDFGWSARRDVLVAVDWAAQRRPGAQLVLAGASLGAAASVFAAAELGARVEAYWLECLYTDLDSAALRRCELHLPMGLGRVAHLALRVGAALRWPQWREISPLVHMGQLAVPAGVWLLAGGGDELATLDDARALLAASPKSTRLIVIEGAPHDRLVAYDRAAYARAVDEFLHAVRNR